MLRVIRIDDHGLTLCIRVNRISGDTLYLCRYDGACDPGEDDLALGIGPVQAVGGKLAILIREERAIRIGDFELHTLQRRFLVVA